MPVYLAARKDNTHTAIPNKFLKQIANPSYQQRTHACTTRYSYRVVCFFSQYGSVWFSYLYFMKYLITTLVLAGFLTSCNKTGKALKERIINADSAAINFFKGDGSMDTVVAVKIIRDKASLEKLTQLVTAAPAVARANCGSDGSIHYFKSNRVVQDIYFRMNSKDCDHFSFVLDGKTAATAFSAGAAAFLTEVKN